MQTVKGKITIDWKYEDGKFVYNVEIPSGINATYNGKKLIEGNNQFIVKE